MKKQFLVALLLLSCLMLPAHGFFWWNSKSDSNISPIHKQVMVNSALSFSSFDFYGRDDLEKITIQSLPDSQYGQLFLGEIPVQNHDQIQHTALSGLSFSAKNVLGSVEFDIIPIFSDGTTEEAVTITIEILEQPNEAPLAKNMDLFTYKNIAITCYFDVLDNENDLLSFQIVDPPTRGAVSLSENGTSSFTYTPYENKTGKDDFKYIVTDSAGNISNEGTIQIRIEKPSTNVTYSDLQGHSAHKSAISLAESGVFVGECIGNTYLFHPDKVVTRDEFLSLAMSVAEIEPLENVTMTGFFDDSAIPTWSKSYVSTALMAGVIQGSWDEMGRPVFEGDAIITLGEASVILDNLLNINTVTEVSNTHWASQASANLTAVGVSTSSNQTLPSGLNRAEVAELLDGALALFKETDSSWIPW